MVFLVLCKEYLTVIKFKTLPYSRQSAKHFDTEVAFLRLSTVLQEKMVQFFDLPDVSLCLCNRSVPVPYHLPPTWRPAVIRLLELSKHVLSLSLCLFRLFRRVRPSGLQAERGLRRWWWDQGVTSLSRYQLALNVRFSGFKGRPYNPPLLFK